MNSNSTDLQAEFSSEAEALPAARIEHTMSAREIEGSEVYYDARGPRDVVLSGPVYGGKGPGRYYGTKAKAYHAMVAKFGTDRVRRVDGPTGMRWAYLIKNLRAA